MNNYHYIIAGLPELLLKGENKDFSYRTIRHWKNYTATEIS